MSKILDFVAYGQLFTTVVQFSKTVVQPLKKKFVGDATQSLTSALIALQEGKWADAEKQVLRHARRSDEPLIHYLIAAKAAQKQNNIEHRDHYLRLAHKVAGDDIVVAGLAQAELQIAADQKEQARVTLEDLRKLSPKHLYVLQSLLKVYEDMGSMAGSR